MTTRRTKIVATLGPASSGDGELRKLVDAGMDVARINLSHGDPAEQLALTERVRRIAADAGRTIGVLVDLPGPKVRAVSFPDGGVHLAEDAEVALECGGSASDERAIALAAEVGALDLAVGDRVVVGDGAVVLDVVAATAAGARLRVVRGGRVQGCPGVHLPARALASQVADERDLALARLACEAGADAIGISFVRDGSEVVRIRAALGPGAPLLVAKVETEEAAQDIDVILAAADAVMVARGDLGLRLSLEDVPHVQKRLIRRAIFAGRPVITATQMLESMVSAPVPTRAEVSDVANAVFDGTDAVMLSGETAIGAYPAVAVETMARVVERAEAEADYLQWGGKVGKVRRGTEGRRRSDVTSDAVSEAAWRLAQATDAAAIVCCTRTGFTAKAVARFRPTVPVVALSPEATTVGRLCLTWGVTTVRTAPWSTLDEMVARAVQAAESDLSLGSGDAVVVVGNSPGGTDPTADVVRIVTMP